MEIEDARVPPAVLGYSQASNIGLQNPMGG